MSVRIFGREPAAIVGLIEAVLALALAFGLGVTQDSYGPLMALVSAAMGLVVAFLTKDSLLGAVVGLTRSSLTLAAVYGLALSDQQTAAVIALASVVTGFFHRTQTSPVEYEPKHAAEAA